MTRIHPTRDAAMITVFLTFAGIASFVVSEGSWIAIGLYSVLMVHTFLSMDCFFRLISIEDKSQQSIDIALILSYLGLAFALSDVKSFLFFWVLLFGLSIMKYAMLIGTLAHPMLLRRKITANAFSVILVGITLGFIDTQPEVFFWMFGAFVLGSVWYIFLNPLYKTDFKN